MRPLPIDFAPKRKLPSALWYTISALLFAVATQQGWAAWKLREQTMVVEAQILDLRAKLHRADRQRQETAAKAREVPPYAKDAAELARIAEFPVEKVLGKIESVQIGGVKVTSLEISATDGTVRAEIEFGEETALLHYMEALNDGEQPSRWLLAEARMNTANSPNVATLTSRWP